MQLGAAYFGKAGYDIKDVINRLSEAEDNTNPLNIYMSYLTAIVNEDTFTNLDSAKGQYSSIQTDSDHYKDAQFYIALIDTVTSLSLLKTIIDFDGDGKLLSQCDLNNNNSPHDVDATACALLIGVGEDCTVVDATYTATGNITLMGKPGIYEGLNITIQDNGGPSQDCPSPSLYQKLLAQDNGDGVVVTTTSRMCLASDDNQWPCPIIKNDAPLELVGAVETAITSAINALSYAIPGKTTDVQEAVNEIKSDNCCTEPGENPNNVSSCTCSQRELATYVRTIKR